ncbi:cubilin-like [Ptychodera flava]|uniref:cubilin-like n=1 Tax=Ptychodera flava TaxID=63121 RepID=UPI00396A260B
MYWSPIACICLFLLHSITGIQSTVTWGPCLNANEWRKLSGALAISSNEPPWAERTGDQTSRLECSWILRPRRGDAATIVVDQFNLTSDTECSVSYLEIRQGKRETSPLYGRYCGTEIPKVITRYGPWFLRLVIEDRNSDSIFTANYRVGDCYHYLDGLEGKFETRGYPSPYPGDVYCEWRIEVPLGHRVRLKFNFIDVYSPRDCHLDYYDDGSDMIIIRDGFSDDSPIIARYCGSYAPDIISKGSQLTISFKTTNANDDVMSKGFQAFYFALDASFCDFTIFIGMPPALYNSWDKHDTGNVSSVAFPAAYQSERQCTWTINSRSNSILLTFPEFDIAESEECREDYIEVFDGDNDEAGTPSFGRYCGSVSPPGIVSSGKHLFIKFKSGENLRGHKGFIATYNEGPYTYLNATTGDIIESKPNKATYFIQAPENHRIYMEFPVLSLTVTDIYGKVIIYEGFTGVDIIAYFSDKDAHPILSKTNAVRLYFELKLEYELYPENFKGLHATYSIVETGFKEILEGDSWTVKHINSAELEEHAVYEWIIYPRKKVQVNAVLEFRQFNLFDSVDCREEYVEIRSGADENSPLVTRLCGNRIPRVFTYEIIYVKFKTRDDGERGSFFAEYRAACEYNIFWSLHGVIKTNPRHKTLSFRGPTFRNEGGLRYTGCLYNVTVPAGYRAVLRFDNITKVESWQNRGYMQVMDLQTGERIGHYERDIPTAVRASDNQIQLRVILSSFPLLVQIRYIGEPKDELFACEVPTRVTFKENQGNMASPNYPALYPNNQDCVWHIITDNPDANIVLTFQDFQLERRQSDQEQCSKDYLEVREGPSVEDPLIGIFCGRDVPSIIVTPSNALSIRFRTDESVQDKGFLMQYNAKCHKVYEGPEGIVEVKKRTPRSIILTGDCTFEVRGSEDSALMLNFTVLGLDFIVNLKYSYYSRDEPATYVDVLAGEAKEHVVRYYGKTLSPNLIVPSDKVYVIYHIPQWSQYYSYPRFFNITYQEQEVECQWPSGDLYIEEFGNLVNPWGNNEYPGGQTCEWRIKSLARLPVRVTLLNVSLHPKNSVTPSLDENMTCVDFLQMSSGQDGTELGGRVCQVTTPMTFISHSDTVSLTLKTESGDGGDGGFQIRYDQGCGIVDFEDELPPSNTTNFDISPGAAPWMAMIYSGNDTANFCSGALLNDLWVITTIPCIANKWYKQMYVKLGKTFSNFTEGYEVSFAVVRHECFGFDYNICILKLDRSVYFNSYIRPICLPTFEAIKRIRAKAGTIGYTFGWGNNYKNGTNSSVLQRIPLESVHWDECTQSTLDNWYVERNYHCARYTDGNNGGDRCYGHNGGPFAKYHEGKWYMVGLVASDKFWTGGEDCPRRGLYGWFWRTVKIDDSIKSRIDEN